MPMSANIPQVPYQLPGQPEIQGLNLYDRLLQERLIFLNRPVDNAIANQAIAAMLYLDAEASDRDIRLYINCQGGSDREALTAGLAIYDTMQCLNNDVITVCSGVASGVSTFLVAVGAPGKRFALPNARMTLSQPTHVIAESSVSAIDIEAKELLQLRQILAAVLAQKTGHTVAKILADTERDLYLSAQAALDYGLIDQIVSQE